MKILLAAKFCANGVRPMGGVQSWQKTVGEALEARGHEVAYVEEKKAPVPQRYDFGVFAHLKATKRFLPFCRRVVQVSHGIIEEERPELPNCFYTSEGVAEHWSPMDEHNPEWILRQPIDTEFWSPDPGTPTTKSLIRFSLRRGLTMLPQIAANLGLRYQHIRHHTPEQSRRALRAASVVIATGRGALEAMACGVPVVIADHRAAYQGPLLDTRPLQASMRSNYSGRGGETPTLATIYAAIEAALDRGSNRQWVINNHSVDPIVDRLLAEYESC